MTPQTGTPFGWSRLAVMPAQGAHAAVDLLRREGVPVIARPVGDSADPISTGGEQTEVLVPTASQERARALLDEAVAPDEAVPSDEAVPPDGDLLDEPTEDGGAGGPEGRMEDLGDLFDAADRLKHQPWSQRAAIELGSAVEAVTASSAPYGMGEPFWERVRVLSTELQSLILATAPEAAIRRAAGALRDLLRPYI